MSQWILIRLFFVPLPLYVSAACGHRSMNTFLIIYLGILLFEAILSTILKYAWQAEDKWNEPFYNQKTDLERNSSQVSSFCQKFYFLIPFRYYTVIS